MGFAPPKPAALTSRTCTGRMVVACAAAVILFAQSVSAISTGRVDGEYITSLFWNSVSDVAVIDGYAYCGMGLGLEVFDLTNPAQPTWKSSYYLGGAGRIIVAGDRHVYLAHVGAVSIFDVSDPLAPLLQSQISIGGGVPSAMSLSGHLLISADTWSDFIKLVDITDPTAPVLLGSYHADGDPYGVAIHDSTVYAAIGSAALQILDVSDPANPALVGIDSAAIRSVVIDFPYLYGFNRLGGDGLLIWDVTDPSRPQRVFQSPGVVRGVLVDHGRAYIQDAGTFRVLDVTDPSAPDTLGESPIGGWPVPRAILDSSGRIVALAAEPALRVLDVADAAEPQELSSYSFDHFFSDVEVYGNLLLLLQKRTGEIHILDITDRELPKPLSIISEIGRVNDFIVRNDTLYASGAGIHTLDLSDPQQPRLMAEVDTGTTYGAIRLRDTLVFAAHWYGVNVFSFSDPSGPSPVGSYSVEPSTGSGAGVLEFDGDTAYFPNWIWTGRQSQINIAEMIDITDPSAPTYVGLWQLPGSIGEMTIHSGAAYILYGYDQFLEVADLHPAPGQPRMIGQVYLNGHGTFTTLLGDLAFIGTLYDGIVVVDVADPHNADTLGRYNPGAGGTSHLAIVDSTAYIAAEHGLIVARLTVASASSVGEEVLPETFALSQNFPNPFNAATSIRYTLGEPGMVRLSVFNCLGQHARTLVSASQPAGTYVVTWDGRNAQGRELGSGVYFYRLDVGDREQCKKMLLLK